MGRPFNEETDKLTKEASREVCLAIIPLLFPKYDLTQISYDERYKDGDVFFFGLTKELSVELEARDAENQRFNDPLNWPSLWNGYYDTLSIPYRKNTNKARYDFYIAYNWINYNCWNDHIEFAFINATALNGLPNIQKMTNRGLDNFIALPIDHVYYGDFIYQSNEIVTHIVNARYTELQSLSNPDLTII